MNYYIISRAEANTRFACIFARLHSYSNTRKVFKYTANDYGAVILAYFINIYTFKDILVIQ